MTERTKRGLIWLAGVCVALVALVWAGEASACPVCYGGAEGEVIEGAKLSVIFMGALVYAVMGGGVAMVVVARRRGLSPDGPDGPERPERPERPEP